MNLAVRQEDPFGVFSSSKKVVESLRFIKIKNQNLDSLSKIILKQLEKGLDSANNHFGTIDQSFEEQVQLIFLEDVVNFCFWAEKNKQKWIIEYSKGNTTSGGWYTLTKCFERAIAEEIPILDADYLINLSKEEAEYMFRGLNGISIPLLKERVENLNEAGIVLKNKYNGKFVNALEEANFDAINIVNLILKNFPSFRDYVDLDGFTIAFLKRAQICAQDFSYLKRNSKEITIKNKHVLSAFADYKIPQMLREYQVLIYNKELADKIDNYIFISQGSREEIEIRAATIWSIELIRQRMEKYTAAEIDNALWLISQNQTSVQPYHRTYTIYY